MSGVALVMMTGLDKTLFDGPGRARLEALDLVSAEPYASPLDIPAESAAAVTVLITGWGCPALGAAEVAHLPNMKLVAHGAGTVKAMVTPELYDAGVTVTSAAHANAIPVAEFTLAALVMMAKDVFAVRDAHRSTRGERSMARMFSMMGDPAIGNRGRTIGLVGASQIGRLVADGLRSSDSETLLYDPFVSDAEADALGAELCELDDLCSRSDVVSLHAPSLPETHHMIGPEQLAAMRDGAWLLNTARGALLDHAAATIEAARGRLNFFLDTTDPEPLPADSPLFELDNVVLTPHIAGSLGNEVARMGEAAIAEAERFLAGQPARWPVRQTDLHRIA